MTEVKYLGDILYAGKKMGWGKGASANDTVYLSGVEGADPVTGQFSGEITRQTQIALDKARDRLVEAKSDVNHIVRMVSYVVGKENVDRFRSAREAWLRANSANPTPTFASTLLVVDGLARQEMLVEVDVTAVVAR